MKNLGVVDGIRTFVVYREAFSFQVLDSSEGGREEQRGAVVAHDAVDFFGHTFVKRAQSRLDMDDGYMDFGSGHGSREGRVGVTVEHEKVRPFLY